MESERAHKRPRSSRDMEVYKPPAATLKPRDTKPDLESKLGKTTVVSQTAPISQSGGFYCSVCDCIVKDSLNYLDHINGKKHQRNLGMSMRVKQSTLQEVKDRIEAKKQEMEERRKEYDINERLKDIQEEEERLKQYKRDRRQKRKHGQHHKSRDEDFKDEPAVKQEDDDPEDDMAKLMGFSSFSTSKR